MQAIITVVGVTVVGLTFPKLGIEVDREASLRIVRDALNCDRVPKQYIDYLRHYDNLWSKGD